VDYLNMARNGLQWVLAVLALWSAQVLADDFYAVRPADIDCVVQAAQRQGVPANVLLAISSKESGKNGQSVSNSNGTFDLGHFQINTTHGGQKAYSPRTRPLPNPMSPGAVATTPSWRPGCYARSLPRTMVRTSGPVRPTTTPAPANSTTSTRKT